MIIVVYRLCIACICISIMSCVIGVTSLIINLFGGSHG